MSSFILGISSGTACLAYCAPTILPFLMFKGNNSKQNYFYLIQFLLGRLFGYIAFAMIAWRFGREIITKYTNMPIFLGFAYIIISIIFIYEYFKGRKHCIKDTILFKKINNNDNTKERNNLINAFIIGIATGINLCPSFLLILTTALESDSMIGSVNVFLFFYLGTILYFLPLPFIGLLKHNESFKTISKFLIIFVSIFYMYKGLIIILKLL